MKIGKKIVITLLSLFLLCIIIFIICLYKASQPTRMDKRMNSDSNVNIRSWVSVPNATFSRAITYTFANRGTKDELESNLQKAKQEVLGGVEGDIPAIFTEQNPEVVIHFQDTDYLDVIPEEIKSVTVEATNKNLDEDATEQLNIPYQYKNGMVSMTFHHKDSKVKDIDSDNDWYIYTIIVDFVAQGQEYTTVTAVNVLESDRIE